VGATGAQNVPETSRNQPITSSVPAMSPRGVSFHASASSKVTTIEAAMLRTKGFL
jgi:hypothetical protein